MATARKQSRSTQLSPSAARAPTPAPIESVIFGDNGGDFRWEAAAADQIDLLARGDGVSAEENAERWLDEGATLHQPGGDDVAGGTLIVRSAWSGEKAGTTLIASSAWSSPEPPRELRDPYLCPKCGHVPRVSGLGRHRVYFEPNDQGSESPVMSRLCPGCRHGLPRKNSA